MTDQIQNGFAEEKRKKDRKISLSVFIFAFLAAILLSFLTAFVTADRVYDKKLREAYLGQGSDKGKPDAFPELKLLSSLFHAYSYAGIDDDKIMPQVMQAYAIATGDRYAWYYTEEEYKSMKSADSGSMYGIGITVAFNTDLGCIGVISVINGSPAAEAGVLPGDLIVYTGSGSKKERVASLGYFESVNRLRGANDTYAEFTVVRKNEEKEIEFKIKRGEIKTESVTRHICETDPEVGIINIQEFNLTTPAQFCDAVDALKASGIRKFVFDLRNNPGGDLDSIVAVLSYFLKRGDPIISTVDNRGNKAVEKAEPRMPGAEGHETCAVKIGEIGKYAGLNCVVLVNGGTASAAELFTANFRDYGLAKIIGTKTYGKGSMQSVIELKQFGYAGALKLTTKMYFSPSETKYDGIGIEPDIVVESDSQMHPGLLTDEEDNQLQKAISVLNG